MVEIIDGRIKGVEDKLVKSVKVGNDGRQFILRIPTKISDHSILQDFKKKYKANIEIDTKNPNKIIVELKKSG